MGILIPRFSIVMRGKRTENYCSVLAQATDKTGRIGCSNEMFGDPDPGATKCCKCKDAGSSLNPQTKLFFVGYFFAKNSIF